MSVLDNTKSKYKDRQHQNPLANENIKLQKLPPVTVRLQAEQHSQIQALQILFAENELSINDVIAIGLEQMINDLDEKDLKDFNKLFNQNVDDKIEILKRKKRY